MYNRTPSKGSSEIRRTSVQRTTRNEPSDFPEVVVEPLKRIRSTVSYSTVEPHKGHVGIKSIVPCNTVEPLNKGHIGIRSTVPCNTVEPLNKGSGLLSLVVSLVVL